MRVTQSVSYDAESPEGRELLRLVNGTPVKLKLPGRKDSTVTTVYGSGDFAIKGWTPKGMYTEAAWTEGAKSFSRDRGISPCSLHISINPDNTNSYVQTTNRMAVATGTVWSPVWGLVGDSDDKDRVFVEYFRDQKRRSQVRFTLDLTLKLTPEGVAVFVDRVVEPQVSAAVGTACKLAMSGDFEQALVHLKEAKAKCETLCKLGRPCPRLKDSTSIAEGLIQQARGRAKPEAARDLVLAAREFRLARASYSLLEYELKYRTPYGEIQKKGRELSEFAMQTLEPATRRYATAVDKFLRCASYEELYDLALRNGFGDLLR